MVRFLHQKTGSWTGTDRENLNFGSNLVRKITSKMKKKVTSGGFEPRVSWIAARRANSCATRPEARGVTLLRSLLLVALPVTIDSIADAGWPADRPARAVAVRQGCPSLSRRFHS